MGAGLEYIAWQNNPTMDDTQVTKANQLTKEEAMRKFWTENQIPGRIVDPLWWTFHDLTVDNVLDFTDKELKIRVQQSAFYKSFESADIILVWNAIHNAQSDRQDKRQEEQMTFWKQHGFKYDLPLRISQVFWDTSIEMLLL